MDLAHAIAAGGLAARRTERRFTATTSIQANYTLANARGGFLTVEGVHLG